MMTKTLIGIPVAWIEDNLNSLNFRQIKRGLGWFYEATIYQNEVRSSEDWAHRLVHRKCEMTAWLNAWVRQGLAITHPLLGGLGYALAPLPPEQAVAISLDTYEALRHVRPMERLTYLWLKTLGDSEFSQDEFMQLFRYQHTHTVYGVLRELRKANLITYVKERDKGQISYRFRLVEDLSSAAYYYEQMKTPAPIPTTLTLPDILWEEFMTIEDSKPIRYYVDWLLYLQRADNHPLTIHELIHNVLKETNHKTVQKTLRQMIDKHWVTVQVGPRDTAYQLVVQGPVFWNLTLPLEELNQARSALKAKEFSLWLWIQAYQPDILEYEELCEDIGAHNELQVLNILKRLCVQMHYPYTKSAYQIKIQYPRLGTKTEDAFIPYLKKEAS